jgi:hypothetical protein
MPEQEAQAEEAGHANKPADRTADPAGLVAIDSEPDQPADE